MHPVVKLFWVILILAAVFWLVTKFRDRKVPEYTGAPVPVRALQPSLIASIDHQLAEGHWMQAVKIYRDATAAPLTQAKQAIDNRRRELSR
jgi:hypothetical protein